LADTIVRKRDGQSTQPFDPSKVRAAVEAAWKEAREVDEKAIARIANRVVADLDDASEVTVEQIQDAIEVALMRAHRHDVARAYILYRQRRAEMRADRPHPDGDAIADYIHAAKYARFRPELGRREVYEETVARVEGMHLHEFPELADEVRGAFDLVRAKRVLPSMRSMQFGGEAIEANNCRIFNCAATLMDRPRAFAEVLYLLLCGTGTGYSVQFEHV
jgi:ribonucleoside-diphosphate reductase alpha chain